MRTTSETEIPSFNSVSTEYVRLSEKFAELSNRQRQVTQELLATHAQMAETGPNPVSRQDRVRALVDGARLAPPSNLQDRVADLARERDDLKLAIEEIMIALSTEGRAASRIISHQFHDEHSAMAAEFYRHVAAAAKVHSRYGELLRRFARAGVEPVTLSDFGREILGNPLARNDTAGIELREAVRRGYLKESELPEFAK